MSFPPTVEAITIQHVRSPVHSLILAAIIDVSIWRQTGGIEVIEKTTRPFPKVNPGDVVIKVCDNACANLPSIFSSLFTLLRLNTEESTSLTLISGLSPFIW
jgi:hypothetical protein